MPQSNVIFFFLFAAFFVFITLRGELRKYMGFLLSSPVASSSPTRVTITGGSVTGGDGTVAGAVGPTSIGGAPLSTGSVGSLGALY